MLTEEFFCFFEKYFQTDFYQKSTFVVVCVCYR